MRKASQPDLEFEIRFYESVLRRERSYEAVIELLGGHYTRVGRIEDGLRMDRRLVRLLPDNPVAHYNLACSLALKRRKAAAIRALRRAVELGYDDLRHMSKDSDLDCLRGHPDFEDLVGRLAAR